MRDVVLQRVTNGQVVRAEHLNQYADAIERLERNTQSAAETVTSPTVLGLTALAAAAAVSSRGFPRRLFLWPFADSGPKMRSPQRGDPHA